MKLWEKIATVVLTVIVIGWGVFCGVALQDWVEKGGPRKVIISIGQEVKSIAVEIDEYSDPEEVE